MATCYHSFLLAVSHCLHKHCVLWVFFVLLMRLVMVHSFGQSCVKSDRNCGVKKQSLISNPAYSHTAKHLANHSIKYTFLLECQFNKVTQIVTRKPPKLCRWQMVSYTVDDPTSTASALTVFLMKEVWCFPTALCYLNVTHSIWYILYSVTAVLESMHNLQPSGFGSTWG